LSDYSFDEIDDLQRNREIEGKTGTVIYFPGDRWIRMLAATDANPKWMARRKIIAEGTRRLANAEANDARYRAFIVPHIAEALCIGWGGWRVKGAEIDFSPEACKALLLKADDVYATVSQVMYDDKKFRGDRIEAVIKEAGE
jgi:hypothetical protein